MLNELLQAANAIPSLPATLHKSLKTLPKYPAFKVLIDAQGAIVDVQPLSADRLQGLRKWQPGGNGFSTPVFSVFPLFHIFDSALDKEAAKRASKLFTDELAAACNADATAWNDFFDALQTCCRTRAGSWFAENGAELNEKCRKSLADIPAQLQALLPSGDADYDVLRALLQRLHTLTPERFFPELARRLEAQLANAYDADLFKLYCAASDAEASKQCNLLLEVADWDLIGDAPITSVRTTERLNALLEQTPAPAAAATATLTDAYGNAATGVGDKFADIVVPGLGKVILRAMTKDAPCQYRYGKADADSFVVGIASRDRAKSALEYLTQPGRRGKTWQFRGGNLFLFYPERELPVLDEMKLVDICSLPDDEDDEAVADATAAGFEARAQRIAAALNGKARESETLVHLIVLRKPDGHRTKLVAHHTFTMAHFVNAAYAWIDGAKACPPIAFARWGKAKGERHDIVPTTPYPFQVASWLNTFWVRGDENQGKFSSFSAEDALTLLLVSGGPQIQMARRALRHALAGWSGFLTAIGAREHENKVRKAGDKSAAALAALPAILALLLCKSDPRTTQGEIMASPAFLVGRLLALADSLHFQYCQGVRNGQVPGQLLGNALMATALETPQAALALYGQRILPYQAWAKTCKTPENTGPESLIKAKAMFKARGVLHQLGDTCSEVCLLDIPERASDADKAQLILGYLAIAPVKTEPKQNEPIQEELL
ncbi:MAG: hypothetical protein Q8N48_00945 [Thiobacillus sp.]|nr:hypothetical protein [Thiobacillus sp.]MDP2977376.1 hypothetical protein [Thiobacillus sp.]